MKKFEKTEKQSKAIKILNTKPQTLLWGGSRSGKTFIIVRNILIRAAKKKSRHLIARLHFSNVKTSIGRDTLPKVAALCFPNLPINLNASDWFFSLPNGSEIWLAGIDTKERVEKILGNEYSTIYFNECSQITDYSSVSTFRTRLAEKSGLELKTYYDANPPSKSHWLHQVFIKGCLPNGEAIQGFEEDFGNLQLNPVDNKENLPEEYLSILKGLPKRHKERFLYGLFGTDVEGALWDVAMIDTARGMVHHGYEVRTVIGVDPAVTNNEESNEWGIIAGTMHGNRKATIREDVSGIYSPLKAAEVVKSIYDRRKADAVIVEKNQGGDMIDLILRQKGYRGKIISVTASKGKFARAEPIQALYEQNLVRHDPGIDGLEAEMLEWVPHLTTQSPNRIDALVWCLWELFRLGKPDVNIRSI